MWGGTLSNICLFFILLYCPILELNVQTNTQFGLDIGTILRLGMCSIKCVFTVNRNLGYIGHLICRCQMIQFTQDYGIIFKMP